MKQKRMLLLPVWGLCLMFGTFALAARPPGAKPPQVIVAPVKQETISNRVEALGTARANESVNITSNVSEKIRTIHFTDGQRVESGARLVTLEQDEEQANLKQAEAILGESRLALQRLLRLEKRQLAATDELDKARLAVEQAEASVAAIRARINDRIIRAPYAGVVGLRNISVGTLVESGDLITTLDDIDIIKLDFTVPAIYLPSLRSGLKILARADALNKKIFDGMISQVDSRIDQVTRAIRVRALLPNPQREILPGMLLQIDLLHNTRQALIIPEAALLQRSNNHYVMLITEKDGKTIAKQVKVQIGMRMPGRVEIVDGLSVQQQVITHGGIKSRPGKPVSIMAVDDGTTDIATIIKQQSKKDKSP